MTPITAPFVYPRNTWTPLTAGKPYSLTTDGDKTFVFEARGDDRWSSGLPPPAYSDTPNMIRSEVYGPFFPPHTPVTLRYTVTLAPGPVTTNCWLILGQMHGDNKTSGSPPLSINIQPDGKGGEEIQVNLNGREVAGGITTYEVIGRALFTRGKPHLINMRFIDSRGGKRGLAQVHLDGKMIAGWGGHTGYADSVAPDALCYPKWGIYAGGKGSDPLAIPDANQTLIATYVNPIFFIG